MTRYELIHLLVGQARGNGFDFRRWFTESTGHPWTGYAAALNWLATGKRAHMLLFSHAFAKQFFQSGERITYVVPPQTFQRVSAHGTSRTVTRKAHLRQSSRKDVWTFHLREMAAATEPLRYIRRFLVMEETVRSLEEESRIKSSPDRAEPTPSAEEADDYDDLNLVRDGDTDPPI